GECGELRVRGEGGRRRYRGVPPVPPGAAACDPLAALTVGVGPRTCLRGPGGSGWWCRPYGRCAPACPYHRAMAARPCPCGGVVGSMWERSHHPCLEEIAHATPPRSEEHTSELQSRENLVCRPLL